MNRYIKNMNALSSSENESLKEVKVCVVGCGGLGGYVIEMLGRIGIGKIVAIDGDLFEESNLNRQILSDSYSLGKNKALMAQERMGLVNPLIEVIPITEYLTRDNAEKILSNSEVIIDALDNIESRFLLQEFAEKLHIPLVHGAIGGWYGQVTTIFPGDRTLNLIYESPNIEGLEKQLGNPSFTPGLIASIQVSEVIKIVLGRGSIFRNKILCIDILNQEFNVLEIGGISKKE